MQARLSHSRYLAGEVLGRGAQGIVFRVVDREDPKHELVAKMWTEGEPGPKITGEFALLAKSRIPGLVRAHDLSRDDATGQPFIVEDYVAGVDARAWLQAASEKDRSDAVGVLLAQTAATLSALHDLGFVHGDLKPAHVRVGAAGRATLVDLGSAVCHGVAMKPTALAPVTRGYAAPELLAGSPASVLSDLYALGALAYAICAGRLPSPDRRRAVRELAPWLAPRLADMIDRLLAPHPRDRPESARELLAALGAAHLVGSWTGDARWVPIGREAIFEELSHPLPGGVRYLVGPSGLGKTHLARGLVSAAQVVGRQARLMVFGEDAGSRVARLVIFLRDPQLDFPFLFSGSAGGAVLLVIDDLEAAPAELAAALDLYRCRAVRSSRLDIVATAREAPPGSNVAALAPLSDADMTSLLADLGVRDGETAAAMLRGASGNPGLVAAWAGRVPLSKGTVLERMKSIPAAAVDLLATIAVAGGALPLSVLRKAGGEHAEEGLAALLESALLTRRFFAEELVYSLAPKGLAADLAASLSTFEVVERLADALLGNERAKPETLLSTASAPTPSSRRSSLLRWCAERSRQEGAREIEMDALMALGANQEERTADLLFRLERLTRDTGRGLHPKVLEWLEQVAASDETAKPLALRRRAEAAARAGDHATAGALVEASEKAARQLGDGVALALAHATRGAVALYRADWLAAGDELRLARERLPDDHFDREEIARIEHNLGVVAIYRNELGDAERAFLRAMAVKRQLGDRAGVRSCLLNLGITLTKLGKYEAAESALDEGLALAGSLGQAAGRGWCLAARADLALRRGDHVRAERCVAEAEAFRDALPEALACDLALLRASLALLEGDGASALRALGTLPAEARQTDPLIDARAAVHEARAHLASVPAERTKAARAAIRAVRRARGSALRDVEKEALAVLESMRLRGATARGARYDDRVGAEPSTSPTDASWAFIDRVAAGLGAREAGFELAKLAVSGAHAERGFVALVDGSDRVIDAFGADLDGLPIVDSHLRLPTHELGCALKKRGPAYFPEVDSPGGKGSRFAVAGPEAIVRGVLILEHRFKAHGFDTVTPAAAARWATLAGLVGRLHRPEPQAAGATGDSRASVSPGARDSDDLESSTSLPLAEPRRAYPTIVGASDALRAALARLDAAVDSELPVLIVGETGTGKELFARALHDMGARARHPFVAVNCGAIADSLFEAEFFGHARGSFTGADRARRGFFARAERGTLLLDEIGDIPLARQASLLRVLESRTYRPVGSDEEHPYDVRVVAATNRDLAAASQSGAYRRDLLYRLQVLEIRVPPLRERSEDVPLLARHFLEQAGSRARLSDSALDALSSYDWPGNVRELKHQMDRLATMKVGSIEASHLARTIRASVRRVVPTPKTREEQERHEVLKALQKTGGNITRAAERLGLTRHGLKKRLVRLGIRPQPKAEGQ